MENSRKSNELDIGKAFLQSVRWLGISKALGQAATWGTTIVLARLLVPEDYGLVGMSGLVVGLITLIGDFGLSSSIIRKKTLSREEVSALFWQYLLIGTLLSLLIYYLADYGAAFWNQPVLKDLIQLSAIAFFFNSLSQIPSALLQRKMKFKVFGFVVSVAAVVGGLVSVALAFFNFGASSLIYGAIVTSIVKCVLVYCFEDFRPQFIYYTAETWSHLKFGTIVTVDVYLWWLYSNADSWIASQYLSAELYGIYTMALIISFAFFEKIMVVIQPAAQPAFAKFDKREDLLAFYFSVVRKTAYLAFPICVILYWLADDLIVILLGLKWQSMIPVFKILILVSMLRFLASFNAPLLNVINKPNVRVKNSLIGVCLAFSIFLVGVRFGLMGMAYSWLLFFPIYFLISMYNVSNAAGFSLTKYFRQIRTLGFYLIIISLAILGVRRVVVGIGSLSEICMLYTITKMCIDVVVGLSMYLLLLRCFDRSLFNNFLGMVGIKR